MEAFILCDSTQGDTLTLRLDGWSKAIMLRSERIEVRIKNFHPGLGPKHHRFYRGKYIPNVIAQYKELNGETLSHGEVDMINKKEANNGRFKSVTINDTEAIIFEELQLSKMTTQEFSAFIDNCNAYWSKRGITPLTER